MKRKIKCSNCDHLNIVTMKRLPSAAIHCSKCNHEMRPTLFSKLAFTTIFILMPGVVYFNSHTTIANTAAIIVWLALCYGVFMRRVYRYE